MKKKQTYFLQHSTNSVYPTLPKETFGNDTPKQWWWMNCWLKHSKEIIEGYYNAKQAEYEQFTSKYMEWIQQYSKDCALKIYANQAELLRRQGIYVAKEFDTSCEVYITVEQLKNLVNPENCSYGVWWTTPNP